MANRLQSVLDELIHKSQTGFQKGKQLGENIIKLLSVIDYCEEKNKPGLLMSINFRKAFDSVRWDFIEKVLDAYNFGAKIKKMFRTINKGIVCTTLNNAKWTEWFPIQKGCRQGSPSSAIIFVLSIEVLGKNIRKNSKIKGITMYKDTVKVCQYADDMWVTISPEAESINELLLELEKFEEFSGLSINYEKTKVMKLRPAKRQDFQYITKKTLSWTTEPIKILGFWIHTDLHLVKRINFEETLQKCSVILKKWAGRKLTVMGKICIINTLISSLFAHKLACLPSPTQDFYKAYKKIVLDFIWENKPHKVSYQKIIQNYDRGGLKLVDLESKEIALKAKWPIYFGKRKEKWLYGPITGDHRLWEYNINSKDIEEMSKILQLSPNNMLVQIWKAWSKINYRVPVDSDEILDQNIWGNSNIRRANKPFMNKVFIESDFTKVRQLRHENEQRLLNYEEFKAKFGSILSVLEFNSMVLAIPATWKSFIKYEFKEQQENSSTTQIENLNKKKNISKQFYWQCIEEKHVPSAQKYLWEKEIGEIDNDIWETVFIVTLKLQMRSNLEIFNTKY